MDMTGVISSQQGSGNYITCEFQKSLAETMTMMFAMDQIDYRQISQIRQALECLAFSLAIENATDGQIEEMEKAVKELDRSQDDVKNAALDKKLHYTLSQASGNILVQDFFGGMFRCDRFIYSRYACGDFAYGREKEFVE